MKRILFNKQKFDEFYFEEKQKVAKIDKKLNLPITIYFGQGHAAKFKK